MGTIEILDAVDNGDCIILTLSDDGAEPYAYVLRADDPYGDAPALRAELQRMVDAGEITVKEVEP